MSGCRYVGRTWLCSSTPAVLAAAGTTALTGDRRISQTPGWSDVSGAVRPQGLERLVTADHDAEGGGSEQAALGFRTPETAG